MKKILVAGTRTFDNAALLTETLNGIIGGINDKVLIVEGGARGADTLARDYAMAKDLGLVEINADWARYGRAAGIKRNNAMVDFVGAGGIAVFFWDGKSKGTAQCIKAAKAKGIETIIINY